MGKAGGKVGGGESRGGEGAGPPSLPLEVQLLWSHHSNPPAQPLSLLFPTMV